MEEELLTCLSRLTFHIKGERGEECRTYFRRWDEAHRKVKDEHKVVLLDRYLGFLLVNSLQMTEGEIESMMAFTRGSLSVKDVKEFVRKHEIKLFGQGRGDHQEEDEGEADEQDEWKNMKPLSLRCSMSARRPSASR